MGETLIMTESPDPEAGGYLIAALDAVEPVTCPCGKARRAFAHFPNSAASIHQVDISIDARSHYHKKMTEIYYVLQGEGYLELDGEKVPVRPGTAVQIRPGTRHRAAGKLKILNICIPPFDPADEYLD